jgi:glyoxylase-like metal-dependent hydrolase (beta-lactamase superfamily II)
MLKQVADGVYVHESEFIQSNTTVVQGRDGVLLVDPGITRDEMADLAADLRELRQPVVAAFSTHPDWDHLLWHPDLADAPRYGTALNAATISTVLASPDWRERVAEGLPPEHADDIPMELLGRITGLPEGTTELPWDGPTIRIIEHRAHAAGHAALLIADSRVLVAGDMLSDILMPFLDLAAPDPVGDYRAALQLFDDVAADVDVVVPGHGSVGTGDDLRARIALDRVYTETLRDGGVFDDPRVGPSAPLYWMADVHEWQVRRYAELDQSDPRVGV